MKRPCLLAALISPLAAGAASAATLTASNVPPTVDGADIAQLNEVGHLDPGGDQGHIWSNRPLQGQTFTTGANPGGYLLNSVTLRNEENTINNNAATFEVRVGTVAGTVFSLTASETSNNPVSYVPDDYMTFVFDVPIMLDPNTLYGFMWDTSGSGFTTWANDNALYSGGEGFSSGGGGVPDDNNLLFRGVDREFHLDIVPNDFEDNDGDGLPDQWEIDHGLDPDDNGENPNNNGVPGDPNNGAMGDPDMDGLDNKEEYDARTDPQDNDTDDDDLLDGVETGTGEYIDREHTGTNPLVADTDGDGLNDGFEVEENPFFTDPNNPDTDGDSVNDGDELAANPFVTDPTNADTDGDGFSDGLEIGAGSDPTDPNDVPGGGGVSIIVVSSVAPVVDGADIAQLEEVGHTDPGGDQGHIWSNRPLQGQTFTTGTAAGEYLLRAVTLRNEENTINDNTATFTVRIGTVDGTVFTEVATSDSNNAISYVPDDYMTFLFGTPVSLQPDTVYGFMWDTSGSGFTTWANDNALYSGGEGFSSGAAGAADDANLIFRGVDREFHLDIEAAGSGTGFMITEVALVDSPGGAAVRLVWASLPGRVYAVDSSPDLSNWDFEVTDSVASGGETTTFEELLANLPLAGPEVFFRVRDVSGQ